MFTVDTLFEFLFEQPVLRVGDTGKLAEAETFIAGFKQSEDDASITRYNLLWSYYLLRTQKIACFADFAKGVDLQHSSFSPFELYVSFLVRAIANRVAEQTDSMMRSEEAALLLLESLPKTQVVVRMLWYHGVAHALYQNLSYALPWFERAVAMAAGTGDRALESVALMGIGNINRELGHYATGLEYLTEAHRVYPDIVHNPSFLLSYSTSLAYNNRLEEAVTYLHKVVEIARALGDTVNLLMALSNLGNSYCSLKRYSLSKTFFEECLSIAASLEIRPETQQPRRIACIAKGNLGHMYVMSDWEEKDIDKGLKILLEVIEELEGGYPGSELINFYKAASFAYEHAGRWEESCLMLKKVINSEHEFYSQELKTSTLVAQAQHKAQLERREKEIVDEKNRELIKANTLKTQMLSIAAHDLRSPLSSILGLTELSLEESHNADLTKEVLSHIQESTRSMLVLVSDLLDSSSAELGLQPLSLQRCSLMELAMNSANRLSYQLKRKRQSVDFSLSDVVVEADYSKLGQVIDNLLSNASKYSPFDSTIYLSVRSDPTAAILTIRDTGDGFSDEDKKLAFGQFQRLSARPTGGEPSTGLGLSIAKAIVERHGGRIILESEGKKKGSTLTVELPPVRT